MPSFRDSNLIKSANFIDGEWVSGTRTLAVLNPANSETIATVADGTRQDAERAVEAAHRSFASWKKVTAKERGAILRRWHDLILENAEDLGALMTWEQGKPLAEAIGEIKYGASFIEFYAEEGK